MRDNPDKTKTENRSSELPDSLQDIFAHTFECIARVDYHGRYLSVNLAYAEVCGYTQEEMIGMSWRETVHSDDLEIGEQNYQELLDTGRSEGEFRGIRKNKSVFYKQLLMVKGLESDTSSVHYYCFIKDTTERVLDELTALKSVKAGLELQEQQFHNLIKEVPGVLFRSDASDYWSFTYLSEGIEKILGIPSHQLVTHGSKDYSAHIEASDRERIKRVIDTAISERQDYVIEYRIQHADGQLRWFRERATCKSGEGEESIWIGGIIRDITDSKQSEKQLNIAQTLIDNAGDSVVWINEEGKFIYVNNVACKLLGYEREELLNLSSFDIDKNFTPENRRSYLNTVGNYPTKAITFESTLRAKNNREIRVEVTSNLVELDGDIYTCASVRDLTQKKNNEFLHHIDQKILQLLARNVGQKEILTTISSMVEEIIPKSYMTLFIQGADRKQFHLSIAPSLSEDAVLFLDEFYSSMSSVETYLYNSKIVENIAASSISEDYREFAKQNNIEVFWTCAVHSKRNESNCCVVILLQNNCLPTEFERKLLDKVSELVGLIIETKATQTQMQRFEKIVESTDDMMLYIDRDYYYRAVNKKYSELRALDRSEIIGQYCPDIIGEETFHNIVKGPFDRCLKGEHVEYDEWFMIPALGRRYCHSKLDPVLEGGLIVGVVIIVRDITRLFDVSEALRESQDRYRSIFENSVDIMIISRLHDGMIKMANRACTRIAGYEIEDLIGTTTDNLYRNTGDREVLIKKLNEFGQHADFETVIKAKNGQDIQMLLSCNVIEYESEKCIFVVGHDISARKEAEAELNEKNRSISLMQKITEAANEASGIEHALQVSLDEICRYCNWPVGHAYILNKEKEFLESTRVWHLDSPGKYRVLRRLSEKISFNEKVGLPGRIFVSKKPVWIEDITKDDNFPRAVTGEKLNVVSAFGFPVLVGDSVVAVLEFFNDRNVTENKRLLEIVIPIGIQMGRIIERKQADLALQQSRFNFNKAVNASPDGVIIIRLNDGKILDINDAVLETTGYSRVDLIENGNGTMFWVSEKECREYVQRLKIEGSVANYSMFTKRKDGTTFPCLMSSTLIDVDGTGCAFSIVNDISDLTIAHEQIRVREKQTQMITDTVPVCISFVDDKLRFCSGNNEFERELGLSAESLVGKSMNEILGNDGYKKIEPYLLDALEGKDVRFEYDLVKPDGVKNTFELTYHPEIKNNIVKGINVVSSNITTRKQTEAALTKTNRALRVLGECNNVLVKEQNESQLLQSVCEIAVKVGGYRMAWVGYANMNDNETIGLVSYATEEQELSEKLYESEDKPLDKRLAEKVLQTSRPYVIRNANDMGNKIEWRDEVLMRGHKSALGLPLNSRGTTIGVLVITSVEAEAFDEEEMNLLVSMGENLAYGIRSIRETSKKEKAESLLALENHAFQMIDSSPSLPDLLEDLILNIEIKLNGFYGSIYLLDKKSNFLCNVASPSLDVSSLENGGGLEIGLNSGPSGQAAYLAKRVTIMNIFESPLGESIREMARINNLRSCTVNPIIVGDDNLLGTFTIYSRETGAPDFYVSRVIDRMTHIIGGAIERYTADRSLKDNEERFALAMEATQDGLWDLNLKTNECYWSPRWKRMLGYSEDELEPGLSTFENLLHPEDLGVHESILNEERESFEYEFRMKHKQGQYIVD